MSGPVVRPRRLRGLPAVRRMVAETRLAPQDLILPAFVHEGTGERPIGSMPGVSQHDLDGLVELARRARDARLAGIMLFGVPDEKDAVGSGATAPEGILNRATRAVRAEVGDDLLVMTDLCLDEFTDHGHCGVLDDAGRVDNDATLERYAEMAVAQARAGAHVVGPSGMMDGQVAVIREALDAAGFVDVVIMAYTAKYASAFYGPFREAVASSLQGDRRTYQQDPANLRESRVELELDLAEGADMVMVKPGLPYLDVLADLRARTDRPMAAYMVSGEYSMIEAAAANGWLDRRASVLEALLSLRRAGADVVLTYHALEVADWLRTTD
ncbi:porphobilinogen synthase [Kytococcus aerolatus]|uniref:Delta-aminolevulinic acid dehydratase n=1 Tax=Kytococcus aerolatus TaxID=592308 RepID=A0A212TDK2_9MICO|nr:porphobilinogen synthase [Kytococcus aerolatus]SNC63914.1 porphobilinogen synthase [Kytococcus aerolatus]